MMFPSKVNFIGRLLVHQTWRIRKVRSYNGSSLRFRSQCFNCTIFLKISFNSITCGVATRRVSPFIVLRWQRPLIPYAVSSPLPFSRVAGAPLLGSQLLWHCRLFFVLPPRFYDPLNHPSNQTSGFLGTEVLAMRASQVENRTTPTSTRSKPASHTGRTLVPPRKSPQLVQ